MKQILSSTALVLLLIGNAHAQQKKNLLFIITDQQRYDALSIAGNSVLETPNLDRLARQGVYFKNAYTSCAVCAPARSSILTGQTVEHHGVCTNDRAYFYDEEVVMDMPTFDEILSENG
jgi:arylsulfatase A-like enzyme